MEHVDGNENDRLMAFSDGVIAITITLMAFSIRLPDSTAPWTDATLWTALIDLAPQYRAYLLSFLVIGIFWLGHRSKFTHITRHSQTLVWLNMLFLFEIGFMPFVTDVLAQSGGTLSTVLSAGTVAIISLTSGAMTLYAMTAGLNQEAWQGLTPAESNSRQLRWQGERAMLQQARNFQEAHDDNRAELRRDRFFDKLNRRRNRHRPSRDCPISTGPEL